MWPFSTPKAESAPRPSLADEGDESLTERLARLEREFLQLQTEWADTLDKIGRHFAKQAARDRQRLHRDIASQELPEPAGGTNGDPEGVNPQDRKAALRAAVNARRLGRAG